MFHATDVSQDMLEEAVLHAPIGLGLLDRELCVLRINQRLAAIVGVEPSSILGRRLGEVLPAVAEQVGPPVERVFRSGEPVEGAEITAETLVEPRRRRVRIASYYPVRAGGSRVRAVGVVVDEVIGQREAREALRASEQRYRYLYHHTPAMMHSIDAEGRIVDVSNAWLERMGYSRDEVIGRRSVEFLTPESRDYAKQVVLPEYFRTGVCDDIGYQFVREDGETLDILLSAVAERDAEGAFQRSLAVLVDVTQRKRAEAALRRKETQLLQAQKMEAIGRLAGGVAHDFNNVLVVILGYAYLLSERLEDPELLATVEAIASAGDRAADLTRQILTFSRQQVIEPRVIDLNEAIRDIETLLRRILPEDVEVVFDLQPSLGRVRIDPGQATQVLMNLTVNAGDAMPEGGRLVIETTDVTVDDDSGPCDPGPYVVLTVTDTGVGMDADIQARIFEPFVTTKGKGRGTGLGLATVYGVVSQAGGCITVSSEPGRGASFRIHLPRVEDLPEQEGAPSEGVEEAPKARTGTVLVVEADAMVRRTVGDMLQQSGYTTLLAADVDDADRILEDHAGPIDLVLTDVVMPGLRPASFIERVRALHPDVPVVYMSGHMVSDIEPKPDPRYFIQKPFTMNELLRRLDDVMAGTG